MATTNKSTTILEKLKKLLFETDSPAVYALADGTEVMITKLEVGGIVTIGDAPAPAGEHTLQDKSKVTVDENGVITLITPDSDDDDDSLELESHVLVDGSTLDVTSMEVGAAVTIGGNMAPAATYVLEDGRSIVVDATGNITEIIAKKPEEMKTQINLSTDLDTPEKMRDAMEKFATGTPEERIANLEIMVKALMEYSFGWQIKEAQEKAAREQAIATYQQKLSAAEKAHNKQKEINEQILDLVTELAESPSADPPFQRTVSSFSKVQVKNKGLAKFADAAKKISDEQKNN